jgi:hypothetical protein
MAHHGATNAVLVYGSTETGEDYSFAMSCNNKRKQSELTLMRTSKAPRSARR